MQHWLEALTLWHWFILAALLLAGETLGAAGFLLGAAVAAGLVGLLMLMDPGFSCQVQLLTFATFTVVFTILHRRRVKADKRARTNEPSPDMQAALLIGKTVLLDHSLPLGHGKMRIGDQQWSVQCDETVEPGTLVRITGLNGDALKILPIRD